MKTRRLIPMLFSTPMVQSIGKRIKTQTRRVVKSIHPEAEFRADLNVVGYTFVEPDGKLQNPVMASVVQCPYGNPGDIIWVRESVCYVMLDHAHDLLEGSRNRNQWVYKSSYHPDWMKYAKEKYGYKWIPSLHMPLRACRYFLEVKSVRVERLQDITEDDAIAEGVERNTAALPDQMMVYKSYITGNYSNFPYTSFATLWQKINGRESWDANPWVWVVEFEVIGVNEMMQFCDEILASYDKKRRGKVHSDLLECIVRLSEKKEATV